MISYKCGHNSAKRSAQQAVVHTKEISVDRLGIHRAHAQALQDTGVVSQEAFGGCLSFQLIGQASPVPVDGSIAWNHEALLENPNPLIFNILQNPLPC